MRGSISQPRMDMNVRKKRAMQITRSLMRTAVKSLMSWMRSMMLLLIRCSRSRLTFWRRGTSAIFTPTTRFRLKVNRISDLFLLLLFCCCCIQLSEMCLFIRYLLAWMSGHNFARGLGPGHTCLWHADVLESTDSCVYSVSSLLHKWR